MQIELIPIKEKRYLYYTSDCTWEGWNKWSVVKNLPSTRRNRLRYSVNTIYKVRVDKEWLEANTEKTESFFRGKSHTDVKLKYMTVLRAVAKELNVNEEDCLFVGEWQYYGEWHSASLSSVDDFGDLSDNDHCVFCVISEAKPIASKKEEEQIEQVKTSKAELKVINTMLSSAISSVIADMGMCIFGTDPNRSTLGFKDGDAFKQYVMKCITRDLKEKLGEAGIDVLKVNKPRTSCRIEASHKWVDMKELRMKKC